MSVPNYILETECEMPIRIFTVNENGKPNNDYISKILKMKVCKDQAYILTDLDEANDCDTEEELKKYAEYEIKRLNLITAYVTLPNNHHVLLVLYWNDAEGNWKVYGAPQFTDIVGNYKVDSVAQDCYAYQFVITHMPKVYDI